MFMLTRRDPLRYEAFTTLLPIDTSKVSDPNDKTNVAILALDAANRAAGRAAKGIESGG